MLSQKAPRITVKADSQVLNCWLVRIDGVYLGRIHKAADGQYYAGLGRSVSAPCSTGKDAAKALVEHCNRRSAIHESTCTDQFNYLVSQMNPEKNTKRPVRLDRVRGAEQEPQKRTATVTYGQPAPKRERHHQLMGRPTGERVNGVGIE